MNYDNDKPSSRVLRPPGGRSSNIFGDPDEPASMKKSPNAKPAYQSSIFGSEAEPAKPRSANRQGHMSSNIFGIESVNTSVNSPKKISKTHQSSIFQEPIIEETRRVKAVRHDPITGAVINEPSTPVEAKKVPTSNGEENGKSNAAPTVESVKDTSPHLGPVKNTSGVRCAQPPGGKSSISFS